MDQDTMGAKLVVGAALGKRRSEAVWRIASY